jgi:hypothetical protein
LWLLLLLQLFARFTRQEGQQPITATEPAEAATKMQQELFFVVFRNSGSCLTFLYPQLNRGMVLSMIERGENER